MTAQGRDVVTGDNGGTNHTGNVRAHSVHEQEVGGVVLLANGVGNTGGHGHSGHTGRADEGVDLALGQPAHDLTAQQTTAGGDDEGDDAQPHDEPERPKK